MNSAPIWCRVSYPEVGSRNVRKKPLLHSVKSQEATIKKIFSILSSVSVVCIVTTVFYSDKDKDAG